MPLGIITTTHKQTQINSIRSGPNMVFGTSFKRLKVGKIYTVQSSKTEKKRKYCGQYKQQKMCRADNVGRISNNRECKRMFPVKIKKKKGRKKTKGRVRGGGKELGGWRSKTLDED